MRAVSFLQRVFSRPAALGRTPEPVPAPVVAPPSLTADAFSRLRNGVVVYSSFRAGSHLLQGALSNLTSLYDVDEVFARKSVDPASFLAYVTAPETDATGLITDPEAHLAGYFEHLFAHTPTDAPLIFSLKYSQAHRLGVDDVTQAPVLLKQLVAYGIPVLHLVRRDVVGQAISHLVADATGQFIGSAPQDQRPIWLDPEIVVGLARTRAAEQRRADAHLAAISARVQRVMFEDLISATSRAEALRRALRFLDRFANVPDGYDPPTRPAQTARVVSNRVEIWDHVLSEAPDLASPLPG